MLFKLLKKFTFFNNIAGTLILVAVLSLSKFNILPFLQNNLGDIGVQMAKFITENNLLYTINSGLIIALFNLLVYLCSHSPTLNITIKNPKMKSSSTELPLANSQNYSHVQIPFIFQMNIKYGNGFWYWICNSILGGVLIKYTYPSWVDLNLDSRFWDISHVDNTSDKLNVDILSSLPKSSLKKYSGEFYTRAYLITKTTLGGYAEDSIKASLVPKSNNIIQKLFMYIFIFLFFELYYESHELKAVN